VTSHQQKFCIEFLRKKLSKNRAETLAWVSRLKGQQICEMAAAPAAAAYKVIMVRHGESVYNQDNRFCGWHDADLAPSGVEEAKKAGKVRHVTNLRQCWAMLMRLCS